MLHKTRLCTAALSAFLLIIVGTLLCSADPQATQGGLPRINAGVALSAGGDASSPNTPLQPLAGDAEAGRRLLEALSRQVKHAEGERDQGDVYLEVTTKRNSLPVDSQVAAAEFRNPRGGVVVRPPARDVAPEQQVRRVRWAYNGAKTRYEMKLMRSSAEKASPTDHVESAYDGTTTGIYYPIQGSGSVSMGLAGPLKMLEESWLTMTTVAGKPIGELLENPRTVYEGSQVLDGIECRKVTIPQDSGNLEIWLSPSHGWRAKRIAYSSRPSGKVSVSKVTEAEGFAEHDGVWFPTKGRHTSYRTDENGQKDWMVSTEWRVISHRPSAPDALFAMHFPIGTMVHDASGEKPRDYTVGEDEKAALTISNKGVK